MKKWAKFHKISDMARADTKWDNPWIGGIALALITLAVYTPAMRAGFVWNDEEAGSLTKNIVLEENGLYRVWFTTESVNYWPVTWTTFWMEHRLWGLNPTGYHVVNVLIHTGCAVLIWRILRRMRIPGAWLAALIFAIHPVNVESAAWITQRKNTLSLLFFLIAFYGHLRHEASQRRPWHVFSLLAFLIALLSKGAVVTLPVVILLHIWWRHGRIVRRHVLSTLPYFAIAALMSAVEIWFQYVKAIGEAAVRDDTLPARLAGAGMAFWFYLLKALLPVNVCFVYPRWVIDPGFWAVYLPLLGLAALIMIAWRYRHSWGRPLLFALGYYIVTLAPVLGFLDIYYMRYSLVADHYQYVSIIGVIALASGAVTHAVTRLQPGRRRLYMIGAVALVLALGAASWRYCEAFYDAETLWRDTLRKNPRAWLAHGSLGNILISRGEVDDALVHYAEALKYTDDAEMHNNFANALRLKGRTHEALEHYEKAIANKPKFADAHNNLGLLLWDLNRREAAIAHFQQAIAYRPKFARAQAHLANSLAMSNRPLEALTHYRIALELDPDDAESHRNLAATYVALERFDDAITHYQRAIELEPRAPRVNFNLSLAYLRTGDAESALRHIRVELGLQSDWPPALDRLAWILATHPNEGIRNAPEAVSIAEKAARLTQRREPRILDTLAAAYAAAGRFGEARSVAEEALRNISSPSQYLLRDEIRERLRLYQQGRAYVSE